MASEAMCRGFKSLQARQSGPLAQLVEQLTLNQRVVGSIPTRPTTLARVFNLLHSFTNRFSRACFQVCHDVCQYASTLVRILICS